ncbi:MAG: hypothetical protein ACKOSS_03335, partial [Planctomycetia bacterium]
MTALEGGRLRVEREGAPTVLATCDPADPGLAPRLGADAADAQVELYAQGTPAFERLVELWSGRDAARVDLPDARGTPPAAAPVAWVASLGAGAGLDRWQPGAPGQGFEGEGVVRATAAVGQDRDQKLCTLQVR